MRAPPLAAIVASKQRHSHAYHPPHRRTGGIRGLHVHTTEMVNRQTGEHFTSDPGCDPASFSEWGTRTRSGLSPAPAPD